MCSFLTVGVDAKRADALETALRAAKLEVGRGINPQVARIFAPGEALFAVTHGGCSCDLTFPREGEEAEARSKLEAKLRRKGYSEAKVCRAVATTKLRRLRPMAEALLGVLEAHAPVRAYFQEGSGDPLTETVPTSARLVAF